MPENKGIAFSFAVDPALTPKKAHELILIMTSKYPSI